MVTVHRVNCNIRDVLYSNFLILLYRNMTHKCMVTYNVISSRYTSTASRMFVSGTTLLLPGKIHQSIAHKLAPCCNSLRG